MILPVALPSPPAWHVDWPAIHEQFEWVQAMQGCPQDPVHHAEGDVWIHVRMVCEALAGMGQWRSLNEEDRNLVFAAALLHDVAKPLCTRTEDGRITARGHSRRGAIAARRILWQHSADMVNREHLCGLVRHHQVPFYLIERADAAKTAHRISQEVRCDYLASVAKADALGRVCADKERLLAGIELFEQLCREQLCLQRPREFPSAASRFEYFRREGRDPDYQVHDEARCEVILMSGLPGSGKDTWLKSEGRGTPVISLDEIRQELGATSAGNQGAVVQTAKDRARGLLRKGDSFAWNATNLSRELRSQLVQLFTDYHARVRIVYVEASQQALVERNSRRERVVSPQALAQMLERWEVPDITEAHIVEWWENGARFFRRRI